MDLIQGQGIQRLGPVEDDTPQIAHPLEDDFRRAHDAFSRLAFHISA